MSESAFKIASIGAGAIRVVQISTGYRFNLDSVLLAHFVEAPKDGRVVELGCGAGVVCFLLAARFPHLKSIVGIDCEAQAIAQANTGKALNAWIAPRLEFIRRDWRKSIPDAERVHCVVSNPPWYASGSGRVNPDASRRSARHEVHGTLSDWAKGVRQHLKVRGKVFVIFRSERLADLLTVLRTVRLEPKRLRFVHDRPTSSAKSVLIEAVCDGKPGCETLAPLFVRDEGGEYSAEVSGACGNVSLEKDL